ncbi:MAG: VWA domain-containing protein [Candidatus Latescibacterota bacterium]|nr:VWA domain-containing protein [Candidatus Latescibacterota bacterium]
MRFENPPIFWLLLCLPMLVAFFLWSIRDRRNSLKRFADLAIVNQLTRDLSRTRQYAKYILITGGFFFSILSLAGPQFGAELKISQRTGSDVVVVLDVSRSMLAEDLKPSRLVHAKQQIRELLDSLEGDRVALVVFAGQAFVQCPLTLDYSAIEMFLDVVDAGMIPVQGTAIGDAVRLAGDCFDDKEGQHKVVVLFTDGEEHVGDPIKIANELAEEDVRIFAVGLGTNDGELIPQGETGGGRSYHKDKAGNYVKTRLDEETLTSISLATDGDYFRSTQKGKELSVISEQISNMDQREFTSAPTTNFEDRFQIPLFFALILFLSEAFLGDRRVISNIWKGRFES